MPDLNFSYDAQRDVLTVEGKKFSGDFFRFFSDSNEDVSFLLRKANDGVRWTGVLEIEIVPLQGSENPN